MIWRLCCVAIWINLFPMPAPAASQLEVRHADRPLIQQIYREGEVEREKSLSPLGYVRYRLVQAWRSIWFRLSMAVGGTYLAVIQMIALTLLFLLLAYIFYLFLIPVFRPPPGERNGQVIVEETPAPSLLRLFEQARRQGRHKWALLLYTHHFILQLSGLYPGVKPTMTLRECGRQSEGKIPAALLSALEESLYTGRPLTGERVDSLVASLQKVVG